MKQFIIIFVLTIICNNPIFSACKGDSVSMVFADSAKLKKHGGGVAKYILPAGLIAYGVTVRFDRDVREFDKKTSKKVGDLSNKYMRIDDYLRFVPSVAVYGVDLLGIPAKHNLRDRTIVMASSHLITTGIVRLMKQNIPVWRPSRWDDQSFPSGHAATAFTGAQILFHEYKDSSVWIVVGGYSIATLTGFLRVMNDRHYVSDVLTGAGIGIVSAELGYALLPVFNKLFGFNDSNKNLVIMPTLNINNPTISLTYNF
jgi:membrane-associated phospholipid phosphatase